MPKRNCYAIILFVLYVCLSSAAYAASYKIIGLNKALASNVQTRLLEWQKNTTIHSEEAIVDQVNRALQPYGYFHAKVAIWSGKKSTMIKVQKGRPMQIETLRLQIEGDGAKTPALQKAIAQFPVREKQTFNSIDYEKAKQSLFDAAEKSGFLRSSYKQATVAIDTKKNIAHITLIFDTGSQYYFGRVQFAKSRLSDALLFRYIPFNYGKPYNTDKILQFHDNLSGSGYFSEISVKPDIKANPHVPIDVYTKPVHKYTYSLGAGYGTDTGMRGSAALSVIPVNKCGHQFNAIARGSQNQNALQAQYLIPGRNPATDTFSINAGANNLDYNSGNGSYGLLAFVDSHKTEYYQGIISFNGLYERYNYTSQTRQDQTLVFPQASFTWHNTSHQLFSPNGYNITLTALAASKAVLSSVSVAQGTIDIKAAAMSKQIRTRLFVHGIAGANAINDVYQLPLSLALLLGGAENMQGYSFNSIGPGKYLTYGGIEIQKETIDNWYLVGFYDAGSVYNPTPREFQYDAGAGIMWVSPIGPIKIAIAQPINARGQRIKGSSPKLVVNMGPDL